MRTIYPKVFAKFGIFTAMSQMGAACSALKIY